jgi:hypothetical protein
MLYLFKESELTNYKVYLISELINNFVILVKRLIIMKMKVSEIGL